MVIHSISHPILNWTDETRQHLSTRVKETQWTGENGKQRKELFSKRFAGANNPGAKTYKFITNSGEEIIVNDMVGYCKENKLTLYTVRWFVNKGKIVQKSKKDTSFKWCYTKKFLQNWEIIEIEE